MAMTTAKLTSPLQFKFNAYAGLGSFFQAVGVVILFLLLLPMVATNIGLKLLLKVSPSPDDVDYAETRQSVESSLEYRWCREWFFHGPAACVCSRPAHACAIDPHIIRML
jgi:hypothetical protein